MISCIFDTRKSDMETSHPLHFEEHECPGLSISREGMASCRFEEEGELPEDAICRKLNIIAGNPKPDEFDVRCPKVDPLT